MRQVIAYYDLVVLGALTTPPADSSPQDRISIRVERVYKGAAPPVLALNQTISETEQLKRQELPAFFGEGTTAMCGYEIAGDPGERYLLFLMARPDGSYEPAGCASHAERSSKWSEVAKRAFELVEAVAGPSSLPDGGGRPSAQPGSRIPRLPVALASGAGGTALLTAE